MSVRLSPDKLILDSRKVPESSWRSKVIYFRAWAAHKNFAVPVNPKSHDDASFVGRVVSHVKSDNHDTALATIRTEVVTNAVVDKVRSLDK